MSTFIKSWSSTAKQDDCLFCGQPVLENQSAGTWKRAGALRTVHADCRPRCSLYGPEKVRIKGTLVFRPDLKDGDIVTRQSPCWPLAGDDSAICAYHRWALDPNPNKGAFL